MRSLSWWDRYINTQVILNLCTNEMRWSECQILHNQCSKFLQDLINDKFTCATFESPHHSRMNDLIYRTCLGWWWWCKNVIDLVHLVHKDSNDVEYVERILYIEIFTFYIELCLSTYKLLSRSFIRIKFIWNSPIH